MLSILIPVFNYDIVELVKTIHRQCLKAEIQFEIIVLDDASDEWYAKMNDGISILEHTKFLRSNSNKGRVETRRSLALNAKYSTLLFLDADALIKEDDYLDKYLIHIPEEDVICGGHFYSENKPELEYLLHWTYGNKIEARGLRERVENPYNSFSTFNFCINRGIFLKLCEKITLSTYGHEDTLIGFLLKEENTKIKHIQNPVIHTGLKKTHIFLEDSQMAISNALILFDEFKDINISIIKAYLLLKRMGLSKIVKIILNWSNKSIKRNLYSGSPNMIIFKLFKLQHLLRIVDSSS